MQRLLKIDLLDTDMCLTSEKPENSCFAMWIKRVVADRGPLLIIERTSNRWILCLTASLDFRGSFNAILSTL